VTISRGRPIPPVANEPVWRSSGTSDATAIVSALRSEGIPATLKRIGDVHGRGSYYTATIYVPQRQAAAARAFLRENGEQEYVIDQDAFRGYGRGNDQLLKIAAAVGGGVLILGGIIYAITQL